MPSKVTYRWVWKAADNSERVAQVSTFQSKERAVEIAISNFPGDADAEAYIRNNEPEIVS